MFDGNMKKFVQLCLIILSVISIALFFYYKHEYNRLRTVLEVLDTFGSNVVVKKPAMIEKNNSSDAFASFSIWKKFGPVFTYSAFSKQNEKQTIIYILAIAPIYMESNGICSVWFGNSKTPVLGNLSVHHLRYQASNSNNALKPILLECVTAITAGTPHAVAPYVNHVQGNVHAIDVVQELSFSHQKKSEAVHVCLLPLPPFFNLHLSLSEFIVFHQAIGVEKFYIYFNSVSLAVKKLVAAHMQKNSFVVNIWSLPEELNEASAVPITNTILMNDCLFRSHSIASYLFVTNTEKYLVPKHHSTVGNILTDFGRVLPQSISRLHCQYRVFCVEPSKHQDDFQYASILDKSQWKYQGEHLEDVFLFNLDKVNIISSTTSNSINDTYRIPSDILLIHWYKACKLSDTLSASKEISDQEREKFLWLKELFSKSSLINFSLSLR